jgi:hypothetical protein
LCAAGSAELLGRLGRVAQALGRDAQAAPVIAALQALQPYL